MRLAHTEVWPAFLYFEAMAPSTAISISAPSKMRNGALPPNSSESFLTVPAHCSISNLPTLGRAGEGQFAEDSPAWCQEWGVNRYSIADLQANTARCYH